MAAQSAMAYSLELGARSGVTPGDISSETGMPDTSGVTFRAFPCIAEVRGAAGGGTERFSGETHGRRAPGSTSLLATGLHNVTPGSLFGAAAGEQFVVYAMETLALSARLRGFGITDPASTPEGVMLGSALAVRVPGQVSITAGDVGTDEGKIPVTDVTALDVLVGDVLIRADGPACTYHEVVEVDTDADVITVHPRMPAVTANGTVFACARVYYPSFDDADYGDDIHVRFAMGGDGADATVGRLAPMARLGGLTLEGGDAGEVQATWTLSTKVAVDNDGSAATVAASERATPAVMYDVGTTIQLGPDHVASTAPISADPDGVDLARFSWSIQVDFTIGDGAHSGKTITMTDDRTVNNAEARLTLVANDSGDARAFKRMLANGEVRQMVVAMGPGWVPGAAGERGVPKGMGFLARMGRDSGERPVRPADGERIEQEVTLRAVNDGPNLSAGTTGLASACWRLAIPMGSA